MGDGAGRAGGIMTSPTQAILDQLAQTHLDRHVPKRPTPDAVKVRYCTGWRMHLAWLIAEDEGAGKVTILFYDDAERMDRQITVDSRRVLR